MNRAIFSLYLAAVVHGIRLLVRVGVLKFYQPIPQLRINIEMGNADRITGRWHAIHQALPSDRLSVLDIGCNMGYYCFKLAELGHFVTGIDSTTLHHLVALHAKEALHLPNIAFARLWLTPDNIQTLPQFDCVLFLAVFHHWCRAYGAHAALQMLDHLYRKTNKVLFFETGQSGKNYEAHLPDMGTSPERWMHDLFRSKGCAHVKTISSPDASRLLIAVYKT